MGDRKCEVCRKYGSCYASDCPDKSPASPVSRGLASVEAEAARWPEWKRKAADTEPTLAIPEPASPFPPELVESAVDRTRNESTHYQNNASLREVVGSTLSVVAGWLRSDEVRKSAEHALAEALSSELNSNALRNKAIAAVLTAVLEGKGR